MTLSQDDTEYAALRMPIITFDTSEGDLDIEQWSSRHDGGKEIVHKYTKEILKGNFLEIAATDWTVQNAPFGTTDLLGVAFKDAEPLAGKKVIPDEVQTISPGPTRQVSVEIFGDFIREVPIAAGGTAAGLGESIAPDSAVAHEWEGTGTLSNNTYVVIAGVATGTAHAIFGYWGSF